MIEALQAIYDFFTVDLYIFVQQAFAQLIIWAVTAYFKIKLFALNFLWGVAYQILDQLNVTSFIISSFNNLDASMVSFMSKYNLLEGINMLVNAVLTRFIWDMF